MTTFIVRASRRPRLSVGLGLLLSGAVAIFAGSSGGGSKEPVGEGDAGVGSSQQGLQSSANGNSMHLHLGGEYTVEDTTVNFTNQTRAYGGSSELLIGYNGGAHHRTLLWFNTWLLPSPANANTARITVSSSSLSLEHRGLLAGSGTLPIAVANASSAWRDG